MSTYYFLICDKHKELVNAASRTFGGIGCHLIDSKTTLPPFIVAHSNCAIRIISEHHEEACSGEYEEWDKDNIQQMANKNRDVDEVS
jgi:hypothetical protein